MESNQGFKDAFQNIGKVLRNDENTNNSTEKEISE